MTEATRKLEDKEQRREKSAAEPFSKKVETLEKMRVRDRSIRSSRVTSSTQPQPQPAKKK